MKKNKITYIVSDKNPKKEGFRETMKNIEETFFKTKKAIQETEWQKKADKELAEQFIQKIDEWSDSQQKDIINDRKAFDEEMLTKRQQQQERAEQTQSLLTELNDIVKGMADPTLSHEQHKKLSKRYKVILQEITKSS